MIRPVKALCWTPAGDRHVIGVETRGLGSGWQRRVTLGGWGGTRLDRPWLTHPARDWPANRIGHFPTEPGARAGTMPYIEHRVSCTADWPRPAGRGLT